MHKIGVFDSGYGGKFVAAELKKMRQEDEFLIKLDTEHVPYGSLSDEQIAKYTETSISELIGICDIIILACNTATAIAIDNLRDKYPNQKFIGFEPMIKPASKTSKTKQIMILATPATLKSKRYLNLIKQYAQSCEIYQPDCSSWATKIENNTFCEDDLFEVRQILAKTKIDTIVLACTHYLAKEKFIAEMLCEDLATDNYIRKLLFLQPIDAINQQIDRLLS